MIRQLDRRMVRRLNIDGDGKATSPAMAVSIFQR
jgi:hypothetical protein